VANLVPDVKTVFQKNTDAQRELYSLLVRSYVDARYNKDFTVSKEELACIYDDTEKLRRLTVRVCETKINSLI